MYAMNKTKFMTTEYKPDLEALSYKSMMEFDSSFNIFFGTANKEIDFWPDSYLQEWMQ